MGLRKADQTPSARAHSHTCTDSYQKNKWAHIHNYGLPRSTGSYTDRADHTRYVKHTHSHTNTMRLRKLLLDHCWFISFQTTTLSAEWKEKFESFTWRKYSCDWFIHHLDMIIIILQTLTIPTLSVNSSLKLFRKSDLSDNSVHVAIWLCSSSYKSRINKIRIG